MSVTSVHESIVIKSPIDELWAKVKDAQFSWWGIVKSCELEGDSRPLEVGGTRVVRFKDGTVQKLKLVELSELEHRLTLEYIESDPPVSFMSALHTIKLNRVTSDNSTYVEWNAEYSSTDQAVIEDSRYKRRDGLQDLARAVKED
ncbi:uncharacterized protein VTP21DRAFT_4340 [Calcarisporiella thermophila]|uniref:uncharacterized protein n=1 Tax=Calcarisporiella thermophila TaxID=911321 RepID=UPI003742C4CB